MIEAARGDRAGDRIDQERHVVIDDADPHPPLAEPRAGRFEPDQRDARLALAGAVGDEGGGGAAILRAEIVELAGKGAAAQGAGETVQQALVQRHFPLPHAVHS